MPPKNARMGSLWGAWSGAAGNALPPGRDVTWLVERWLWQQGGGLADDGRSRSAVLVVRGFRAPRVLASGDAALTRRRASTVACLRSSCVSAAHASATSARVCCRGGGDRKAEAECLGDADARARRREREQERRANDDVEFERDLAREITRIFPGCPKERAEGIATHTGDRSSGRVGRTAGLARLIRRW